MFFLLLLAPGVFSTLKRGDDPYKILGVRRDASENDIKKAYRQITKKYHPDVAKIDKKEAEHIFIRATDAYELLTDEKRRRIFDQTGSVSDDLEMNQGGHQYRYQYSSPEDIFSQFFGFQRGVNIDFKTEEVSSSNIDKILKENKELFIFVYDGNDGYNTPHYAQFFEEVSEELGNLAKFVRNNIMHGQAFAKSLGVRSVPSFIHMKTQDDGTRKTEIETGLNSRTALLNWVEKCWSTNFKYFKNAKKLEEWINTHKDFTRVISIERGNEPSMEFKKASSQYHNCLFAVVIDDYVNVIRYLKLTELPSTIVFRSDSRIKLKSYSELKSLSNPFFAKLERNSLKRECAKFCLLRIGKPSQKIMSNFSKFTEAPTMWISSSTKFARSLNVKEGGWVLISGSQKKYASIDINKKYAEISKFNSRKLIMKPLVCDVDWSFDSLLQAAKALILSILYYLNPLNLLGKLFNSGISLEFPLFLIIMFIIFPMFTRFLI